MLFCSFTENSLAQDTNVVEFVEFHAEDEDEDETQDLFQLD